MIARLGLLSALAIACARGPEGSTAGAEAAALAADALLRANACTADLQRADPQDVRAVVPMAAIRAAPYRGTPREASALRDELSERLESVRADASAAGSLASLREGDAVRRAEERAVRAIRASDELCRAAAGLGAVRVARRTFDP
jgi:hypothetical protein